MNFLIKKPDSITPDTKCLIMLHGVWSSESDLFSLCGQFWENTLIFSIRWPFSLGMGRFAWYPVDFSTGSPVYRPWDVVRGYDEIMSMIREVRRDYALPVEHIFLMGFSQGAIMSYYTLWRSPEWIGGIIALSGRILTEIDTEDIDTNAYESKRVFIWHGVDDQVIPVTETGATSRFVRSLGLEPVLRFYDAWHTITREEIADIRTFIG